MKSHYKLQQLSTKAFFGLIVFSFIFFAGCREKDDERLLSAVDDKEVYNDKVGRYKSMSFLTQSYLDYMILNVNVLPVEKNSLEFSVLAPPVNPEIDGENHWGGAEEGSDFSWDTKWKTPKQFKVWWQRVVDPKEYAKSGLEDRYIIKETEPGTAWCEAIVTIEKPLPKEPRHFILHFYPDGHVEAYISGLKETEAEKSRIDYKDRERLPALQGKNCLKEIPNPYYGLPRPVHAY